MVRILQRLILASMAMACVSAAAAAEYFDVEVIIYANIQTDTGEEYWPEVEEAPDLRAAYYFEDSEALQPLDSGSYQLTAIENTLARSSLYRPLLHFAWRQPGWEKTEALPVRITLPFGTNPPVYPATMPQIKITSPSESIVTDTTAPYAQIQAATPPTHEPLLLEGALRVYLSRYLHLNVDLLYRERVSYAVEPEGEQAGVEEIYYQGIRMQQSRRMRSNELHYLDHPRLGVIARITPVEVEEEEPTTEAADDGGGEATMEPAVEPVGDNAAGGI